MRFLQLITVRTYMVRQYPLSNLIACCMPLTLALVYFAPASDHTNFHLFACDNWSCASYLRVING